MSVYFAYPLEEEGFRDIRCWGSVVDIKEKLLGRIFEVNISLAAWPIFQRSVFHHSSYQQPPLEKLGEIFYLRRPKKASHMKNSRAYMVNIAAYNYSNAVGAVRLVMVGNKAKTRLVLYSRPTLPKPSGIIQIKKSKLGFAKRTAQIKTTG